jgi:dihydrofolate reductase
MRVVVNEFMSLDGIVQAPGGPAEDTDGGFAHGGWSIPYFDPEIMGGAIGEGMNAAWPDRAGHPYADQMNTVTKYVASRTLTEVDLTWNNSTLLSAENPLGEIAELRRREGGDIVMWGSLSLVRTLLAHGLVDELNLMIEPIILGGGKKLFPDDGAAVPMELVSSITAPTGVLVCTYRPA